MKNPLILSILLSILAGCDQIKEPIPPGVSGTGPVDGTVRRRVLLEDFTGHRCNNCPAAASTAQNLQALYGEDVVVVGVHVTETFAAPLTGNSYTTDFRTPAGDVYEDAFNIFWLPAGMVNRKVFNSSQLLAHTAWSSAVSEMIGQEAAFDIWFDALDHNTANNSLNATVKVAVLEPVTGAHALTVYLTEDHVIDWQYDVQSVPDPDVPDYEHRHVLRTNLNGPWGDEIIATEAAPGDTLELTFNNVQLSPEWNITNCALVAYVHSTVTNEVMQVLERKIDP